ncbi:hypothetical protein V6U77_14625 [Micromonospora sp. CPCC 205546]
MERQPKPSTWTKTADEILETTVAAYSELTIVNTRRDFIDSA